MNPSTNHEVNPMKRMMPLLLLIPGLLAFTLPEGDDAAKGLAVATEMDARDAGFENFTATMKMVLANRQGQSSERDLRVRTLEVEADGDKSLIIFDSPRDVKGTAFLSFSHATGSDDQWLYLPALKRVKRIASNNKSGPFMGSEFAYEDISSQEIEKYEYRYLREEDANGLSCHVIERYPLDKNSGYRRQIVWIDQEEFRIQRVVFHDRKDSLLKTLEYDGYRLYAESHWRPDLMRVENHQTGKSTELLWSDYAFKTDLNDGDFDKNALKRVR